MRKLAPIHFVIWSLFTVIAYTERVFGLPLVVLLLLPVIIRYLNHNFNLQISGVLAGIILGTVYAINYWITILLVTTYLFFSRANNRRSYRRRLFWALFYTFIFLLIIRPQITWWLVSYHLLVVLIVLFGMYLNLFRRRQLFNMFVFGSGNEL